MSATDTSDSGDGERAVGDWIRVARLYLDCGDVRTALGLAGYAPAQAAQVEGRCKASVRFAEAVLSAADAMALRTLARVAQGDGGTAAMAAADTLRARLWRQWGPVANRGDSPPPDGPNGGDTGQPSENVEESEW